MGCLVYIQVFSHNFINYLEEEINSMLIKFAADNNWEILPTSIKFKKRKRNNKEKNRLG